MLAISAQRHMQSTKNNVSLIIGIAIPFAMIAFVAGSIYLPGLFAKPTVDFVYAVNTNNHYDCKWRYEVQGDKVTQVDARQPYDAKDLVRRDCQTTFYRYDVLRDKNIELTLEEAQALKLSAATISPDGFEIVRGGRSGGFLFLFDVGSDYDSVYLRGHNVSRKLAIQKSALYPYSYPDYQFLGWVVPR